MKDWINLLRSVVVNYDLQPGTGTIRIHIGLAGDEPAGPTNPLTRAKAPRDADEPATSLAKALRDAAGVLDGNEGPIDTLFEALRDAAAALVVVDDYDERAAALTKAFLDLPPSMHWEPDDADALAKALRDAAAYLDTYAEPAAALAKAFRDAAAYLDDDGDDSDDDEQIGPFLVAKAPRDADEPSTTMPTQQSKADRLKAIARARLGRLVEGDNPTGRYRSGLAESFDASTGPP